MTTTSPRRSFSPIVSIVGFHHAKGPDIEHWFGGDANPDDPITEDDWPFFPFMALYDGSHSFEQDFSYFTLKREARGDQPAQTLFAISCTRQVDARLLLEKSAEVTRSTVQKAVVVITDSPIYFGHLREQLSMVTKAWFAQLNFDDLDIIKRYHEGLVHSLNSNTIEKEGHLGLSLRELIYSFRHNSLVLLKCALLQPKMLFFSSKSCERLCMTQFSLISLIPGLFEHLQDASDPELNTYEAQLVKPTTLKSSDRKSLLRYMGCPLQIFGKGSLFGPYTPLQQLDVLADKNTTSYLVGSTNSLLLQQKDRYSDIIINLDDGSLNITSTSLRSALALTAADRRWIDALVQTVVESWNEVDPSRPKDMTFAGSEDFIRMQFEEYILALLSSVKYSSYLEEHNGSSGVLGNENDPDPLGDFGLDWVHAWKTTDNYRIFENFTEAEIFDVIPPRHVCAGGLTLEDVTRRLNQQLADLKLDEKYQAGRDAIARTYANTSKRVTNTFSTFWADLEASREARRRAQEETAKQLAEMEKYNAEIEAHSRSRPGSISSRPVSVMSRTTMSTKSRPASLFSISRDDYLEDPEVTSPIVEIGVKAGALFSSWGAWANDKRKRVMSVSAPSTGPTSVKSRDSEVNSIAEDKEYPDSASIMSGSEITSIAEEDEDLRDNASNRSDDSIINVTRSATIRKLESPDRANGNGFISPISPTTKIPISFPRFFGRRPSTPRTNSPPKFNGSAFPKVNTETQKSDLPEPVQLHTEPLNTDVSKHEPTTFESYKFDSPDVPDRSETPKPPSPERSLSRTESSPYNVDATDTVASVADKDITQTPRKVSVTRIPDSPETDSTPRPKTQGQRSNSILARIQKFEGGAVKSVNIANGKPAVKPIGQVENGEARRASVKSNNDGFDDVNLDSNMTTTTKMGNGRVKVATAQAVVVDDIDDLDDSDDDDEEYAEAPDHKESFHKRSMDVPDVQSISA